MRQVQLDKDINIPVVILAAGESKRFGSPKQLADWFNEPLLVSVIKKMEMCGVKPYVALGGNIDLIRADPALLPYKSFILQIENWHLGISQSIKESIFFLEEQNVEGIMFLLGDQPLVESEYLATFLEEALSNPTALLCTDYGKKEDGLGVPAYFPSSFFKELKALEGNRGAKKLLAKYCPKALIYEGLLMGVDEPGDLVRARAFKTTS